MKVKIKESQLRQIIRESLDEFMKEGRPRIKPSYWEQEDYRNVDGIDLYIPNPIKMPNPKLRDPERLKNALMNFHALYAEIDEQGGVHGYFYRVKGEDFSEYSEAWDEDAWECMSPNVNMKGIAKQIPVKLYQHVPNFEKIWKDEVEWTKKYRDNEIKQDKLGGATSYNTIPTLRGGGTVDY